MTAKVEDDTVEVDGRQISANFEVGSEGNHASRSETAFRGQITEIDEFVLGRDRGNALNRDLRAGRAFGRGVETGRIVIRAGEDNLSAEIIQADEGSDERS